MFIHRIYNKQVDGASFGRGSGREVSSQYRISRGGFPVERAIPEIPGQSGSLVPAADRRSRVGGGSGAGSLSQSISLPGYLSWGRQILDLVVLDRAQSL